MPFLIIFFRFFVIKNLCFFVYSEISLNNLVHFNFFSVFLFEYSFRLFSEFRSKIPIFVLFFFVFGIKFPRIFQWYFEDLLECLFFLEIFGLFSIIVVKKKIWNRTFKNLFGTCAFLRFFLFFCFFCCFFRIYSKRK